MPEGGSKDGKQGDHAGAQDFGHKPSPDSGAPTPPPKHGKGR
jgi:hypothetical protein